MSTVPRIPSLLLAPLLVGTLVLLPDRVEAQPPPHGHGRVSVGIGYGYGYGYPWYPYYGYWGASYPWGPWWGPGFYGYPVWYDISGSLRLDVRPKDAEVFVDGYSAGRVTDFDGIFQRLRLPPGSHEITLYKPGYRTVRQNIYLAQGSDQKIRYDMEQLAPGETSEPPPPPVDRGSTQSPRRDPFEEPFGPEPPAPAGPPVPAAPGAPTEPARDPNVRFGTLSIRVQPTDAEILIDGEPWSGPSGQDRLSVQLAEGRHRVEIRKTGFATYREEVLIRRDRALTLNVSLLTGDGTER